MTDVAIEQLGADEICWELAPADDASGDDDLLTTAVIEAQSYRLLAQLALNALHQITVERDVLRGQRSLDRQREREARA